MDMGKLNVKNGTPVGNEHLCKSCSHALYVTGYRESDVLVICVLTDPSFRVPFVVHQCSDFLDKRKPDWEQMEKLAIEIQFPGRREASIFQKSPSRKSRSMSRRLRRLRTKTLRMWMRLRSAF